MSTEDLLNWKQSPESLAKVEAKDPDRRHPAKVAKYWHDAIEAGAAAFKAGAMRQPPVAPADIMKAWLAGWDAANVSAPDPIFGKIISCYTRAQALEDGMLVELDPKACREAGFKFPVAMTSTAFEQCVAVPAGCEGLQDVAGRLWDVLWMMKNALRTATGSQALFKLHVVQSKRDLGRTPPLVTLKVVLGPGDDAAPVFTVMLPEED